jgi:predicted nucleic acid-binding protein
MPDRVVDASVIGAIVFNEPAAGDALALVSGQRLFAPTLLFYELTSIARTKAVRRPEERDRIARDLEAGLAMDIRLIEPPHPRVLRIAMETGLSTYDASYLCLARLIPAALVSFDQRLLAASGR